MYFTSDLIRFLQRKRYQYEVTLPLYMLTPTEKFIFNSFLFLFVSMVIIAAALYLPQHITEIASRAWFYYAGDEGVRRVGGKWDGIATSSSNGAFTMTRMVGEL